MSKQRIRHLIYFIILVGIDQITKYWVKTTIAGSPVTIIPKVLKLEHSTNSGAAWGIFDKYTGLLIIFTLIILLALVFLYFKFPNGKKYNALKIIWIFIISGAVGNLIDRIAYGYVIDFIYFELIDFPNFNMADAYLTLSCIMLLLIGLLYYKDEDLEFITKIFSRNKKMNDKDISNIEDEDTKGKDA